LSLQSAGRARLQPRHLAELIARLKTPSALIGPDSSRPRWLAAVPVLTPGLLPRCGRAS
jgi:hypothetical protein